MFRCVVQCDMDVSSLIVLLRGGHTTKHPLHYLCSSTKLKRKKEIKMKP